MADEHGVALLGKLARAISVDAAASEADRTLKCRSVHHAVCFLSITHLSFEARGAATNVGRFKRSTDKRSATVTSYFGVRRQPA